MRVDRAAGRLSVALGVVLAIVVCQSTVAVADGGSGDPRRDECTVITVAKKASADGSVMTSHTCDSHRTRSWLDIVPAQKHKKGSTATMVKRVKEDSLAMPAYGHPVVGEIPQVEQTHGFINTAYPCMNDAQLAIGESTFGGRESLHSEDGLIDCQLLVRLMLERCTTAREAIGLAGDLLQKYHKRQLVLEEIVVNVCRRCIRGEDVVEWVDPANVQIGPFPEYEEYFVHVTVEDLEIPFESFERLVERRLIACKVLQDKRLVYGGISIFNPPQAGHLFQAPPGPIALLLAVFVDQFPFQFLVGAFDPTRFVGTATFRSADVGTYLTHGDYPHREEDRQDNGLQSIEQFHSALLLP